MSDRRRSATYGRACCTRTVWPFPSLLVLMPPSTISQQTMAHLFISKSSPDFGAKIDKRRFGRLDLRALGSPKTGQIVGICGERWWSTTVGTGLGMAVIGYNGDAGYWQLRPTIACHRISPITTSLYPVWITFQYGQLLCIIGYRQLQTITDNYCKIFV